MSATLASLRIRNLALVEDITWEPSPGFIAITGETGAGKSVLIGALTLLLGERGDKGLIRNGTDFCTVEAVFENVNEAAVISLLDEYGAEPCEDQRLIIKRTLPQEGTGRQYVNGSPCTLALLRALGVQLIDLHGPHDHQSLFSRERQTRLLDSFAGHLDQREDFAALRKKLLGLQDELRALQEGEQTAAREIDLLTHQVNEIEEAQLTAGEEEALVIRQRTASNRQRIQELSTQLAGAATEDDDSLISRMGDLSRLARELHRLDPSAQSVEQLCEAVFSALDELSRGIATHASSLDQGEADPSEIESRLDLIQSLKRKYGHSVDEVLAFGEEASTKLDALKNRTERTHTLDADIAQARKELEALGKKLGSTRATAAKKLAEKVRLGLKDLGFAKAEFSISLEKLAEPVPHGYETAEFLFAPNPGEPAHPLRSIASSGEISRVMLALKGALADEDEVPLLVFDEIDANVGGEIAAKVGFKMRELASARQVLCITHLPQVAASASEQFIVHKEVKDGRTRTLLAEAKGKARETEIARMLGGQSASALAHAKTLLKTK